MRGRILGSSAGGLVAAIGRPLLRGPLLALRRRLALLLFLRFTSCPDLCDRISDRERGVGA